MTTELLGLSEISTSQASKEATHNAGLRQIEGRTIKVKSRTTSAEPGSPSAGDTYIVPSGATGTNWASQDGKIAHYYGGAWVFYAPIEGIRLWVDDEDVRVAYDGSAWIGPRNPLLTKSVAGGSNVTLTTAESEKDCFEFTGALTANIEVIVPTIQKQWTVYNNTSGAYTLTLKTSGGSGIAVGQGNTAILRGDGANVVRVTADV